jgi:hypothetical protein
LLSNGIADKTPVTPVTPPSRTKTVVKMKKVNRVYQVPAMINGVAMDFIFETGASLWSRSVSIRTRYCFFPSARRCNTDRPIVGISVFVLNN